MFHLFAPLRIGWVAKFPFCTKNKTVWVFFLPLAVPLSMLTLRFLRRFGKFWLILNRHQAGARSVHYLFELMWQFASALDGWTSQAPPPPPHPSPPRGFTCLWADIPSFNWDLSQFCERGCARLAQNAGHPGRSLEGAALGCRPLPSPCGSILEVACHGRVGTLLSDTMGLDPRLSEILGRCWLLAHWDSAEKCFAVDDPPDASGKFTNRSSISQFFLLKNKTPCHVFPVFLC